MMVSLKTIVSVTALQPKLSQVAICLNVFLTMIAGIKVSKKDSLIFRVALALEIFADNHSMLSSIKTNFAFLG